MSPEAFSFETSGQLVMQTVIGGAGTLIGPLVGGALWLYLRNELQSALGLGAAWKLILGARVRGAHHFPAPRHRRRRAPTSGA